MVLWACAPVSSPPPLMRMSHLMCVEDHLVQFTQLPLFAEQMAMVIQS